MFVGWVFMKRHLTWILIALFLLAVPLINPGQSVAVSANEAPVINPVTPTASPVRDVSSGIVDIKGHWGEKDIKAAVNQGWMTGMGKTSSGHSLFSPEATVSRAQLATALVRAFQLDYGDKRFIKQPQATDYYRDVNNKAWYAEAVVYCAINGIFPEDKYFHPNQNISRIEMAQAIEHCFKAKGINIPMIMSMPTYRDMEGLSQEETNALVFVNNTGIMKGDGERFRPQAPVKRAELARLLNRVSSMMSIDESYNHKEYTISAGKSFVLGLTSNPSTGYTWTLADAGDKNLLKLVNDSYEPGPATNIVGQAGKQYWTFQGLKPGTTEIKIYYARPWESKQPEKTFSLKVIIK